MKKQLACLCAVASLGLVAQAADSQAESGWFGSFGIGAAFQGDIKIKEFGSIKLPASFVVEEPADFIDFMETFDIPDSAVINGGSEEPGAPGIHTASKAKIKTDTGINFDLAAGYRFNDSWAVTLETGLIYNSLKSMEMTFTGPGLVGGSYLMKDSDINVDLYQVPIMVNAIFTVPLEGNIKPYVGAGLGGVMTFLDGEDTSENSFTWAWQLMAGADYKINENWSAGAAYKLLGTGENDWDGVKSESILTHSIMASVTYSF